MSSDHTSWFDNVKESGVLHQTQFSGEAARNMQSRGYDVTTGTHGTKWVEGMNEVVPADTIGANNHEGISRTNRAYYTANPTVGLTGSDPGNPKYDPTGQGRIRAERPERSGWVWASSSRIKDKHAVTGEPVPGRDVVHKVKAKGHIDEDPVLNQRGLGSDEMTADKLEITDTEWIPFSAPEWFSDEEKQPTAMQGTLPNYNWNRQSPVLGDGYADTSDDYNSERINTRRNRNDRLMRERRDSQAADFNTQSKNRQQILGQQQFDVEGILKFR